MLRNQHISMKIWSIVYPLGLYYGTVVILMFICRSFLGTSPEKYMICQILSGLGAVPVVLSFYLADKKMGCQTQIRQYAIPWSDRGEIAKAAVLSVLLALLFAISLNNLLVMSPLIEASEAFSQANEHFFGSTIVWEILGSAIMTPIIEELIYRGVLFSRMMEMMGRWQAVLLSSLIFAIMHFNIVQFIYAFCVGIVLALLMEHTGHLAAAILAHMAANLFAVLRTEYGFLAQTADGSIGAWGVSIFLLLVGIAMGYEFFRKKPSE